MIDTLWQLLEVVVNFFKELLSLIMYIQSLVTEKNAPSSKAAGLCALLY